MIDLPSQKILLNNLKKPKAIIFDWDNTLVDTWPLIKTAINNTMSKMGRDHWSLEKVKNTVHKSMRDSFPEIFGDNWQQAGEIYRNSYHAINIDKIELLPNSLNLIKKINELGIAQFIISNKIGSTLRKEAKKLAVDKFFFSIIGSQDADFDKPDKSVVNLAILGSEIDLLKDEVWFIGDTIADIECAYNANCTPIIYGHSNNQMSNSISLDLVNDGKIPVYFDHIEIINLLDAINKGF